MKDLPTYAWPVAIAMIVLALIQLVKSDKIPITIPPRARPWVALALGILGGAAAAVIAGRSVLEALVTGITGGTGSVGLFELGSSMKPGGPTATPLKDGGALPPDDPYRSTGGTLRVFVDWPLARISAAIVFALVAVGCGAVEKVQHVVQMSSEVIARAEPCLVIQYEAQQEACLALATDVERRTCVANVKATWKPIVDALVELRTVRCEIEPAKCDGSK